MPSITVTFGKANAPTLTVDVVDAGYSRRGTALLDSGAEMSGLSQAVANSLGLAAIGTVIVQGATGSIRTSTYAVDLDFNAAGLAVVLNSQHVFEIPGTPSYDVLIGRDIICSGTSSSQLSLGPGFTFTLQL